MASCAVTGAGIHSLVNNLDITFLSGDTSLPLIVFIHGLGMDLNIWTDPDRSRIMAGSFPLTVLLGNKPRVRTFIKDPGTFRKITIGKPPKSLPSLYHSLNDKGFSVLGWSQRRPLAPARVPVEELGSLLATYRRYRKNGMILIGHSRGGLIAWTYALRHPDTIKAVITLGSPFYGSTLAKWAKLLSKVTALLGPVLPKKEGGTVRTTIKRIKDFIQSTAVKELLPGSPFLDGLKYPLKSGIKTICLAGSNPSFIKIHKWRKNCSKDNMGNTLKYQLVPRLLFSFPDSFPGPLPDELTDGKGDGLVSAASAVHHHCLSSDVLPLNHVQLLFSSTVHSIISDFITDSPGAP